MNLNFLSGLLLTIGALAIVGYVIAEIVSDRADIKRLPRYLADVWAKNVGSEAKPVNAHLIASVGQVIAHSDDDTRPMKVRLGFEHWAARLNSSDASPLPVGTSIKVTAIDGHVLVVEASTDAGAS